MIFRPSIKLLEEILEEKTNYGGVTGFVIWNLLGTILAPWLVYLLLKNNNNKFITDFAVELANNMTDEDEDA